MTAMLLFRRPSVGFSRNLTFTSCSGYSRNMPFTS